MQAQELKIHRNIKRLILALLLALPVSVVLIGHGASAVFFVLSAAGLVFGIPEWKNLEDWERRILGAFIILLFLMAANMAVTIDMRAGLRKLERIIRFPLAVPIYLLLRRYEVRASRAWLRGFIVAGFTILVVALIQIEMPWERASGAYNPIVFGCYSVFVWAILITWLYSVRKIEWLNVLAGIGMLAAAYAGLLSGTRGALIFIPILLLIYGATLARGRSHKILALFVLFILLGIIGLFLFSPPMLELRLLTLRGVAERLYIWEDSLRMLSESPLFGTGPGDFGLDSKRYIATGISMQPDSQTIGHSIYFDWLGTTGIIGTFTLIVIVFLLPATRFLSRLKQPLRDDERFCALGGLVTVGAFMVFGITNTWFSRMPLITIYLISIVVFLKDTVPSGKESTESCHS